MQVLQSAVTEVQLERLCSRRLVNNWAATLPHRGSAVCRRSHRFPWKRLWLVASRRCWRVQRRKRELHRLEEMGNKNWIYWTRIQLTWDDVAGTAIAISEAWWNRQLSLFTCKRVVNNKSRRKILTQNPPMHMSSRPWSQPLMTWPAPSWKLNGWSLS